MKSSETKTNENSSRASANQAFGKNCVSLFSPGNTFSIQPKLAVNQPNDVYEQEADSVADAVMRMTSPDIQTIPLSISGIQRKCAQCEEEEKNMQRKEFNNEGFAQTDSGGFIQLQEDGEALPEELDEDEMIDRGGEFFPFLQRKEEANNAGESQKITSLHGQHIQRYLVGPPQRIEANTTAGPTYGNCRNFNHVISWSTDLRDGYIIQECNNSDTITGCDGTNIPAPNTPHYWEAWYVDASGAISDGNSDTWFRAQRNNTQGRWTFDSNVYAVPGTLKPAWGFTRGAVATAGSLLSTTTGPGYDELYQPSLTRHRGGAWDCCNGNNSHTPI